MNIKERIRKNKKAIAVFFSVAAVTSFVMLVFGIIMPITFWFVIIPCAMVSYYLPKI